jgi:hypothetical protein
MAFATVLAATAIGAHSRYQQGLAASAQAKAQARMDEYNAQVSETNARAIRQKSIFDQIRALKAGQKRMGSLVAKLGASGAVVSEGAPANLIAEQGFENALDVALIGYEGLVREGREKSAAQMYRNEAENYMMQSKYARRAGLMGAGTTLLSGFGTMSEKGMFPKPLDFLNM